MIPGMNSFHEWTQGIVGKIISALPFVQAQTGPDMHGRPVAGEQRRKSISNNFWTCKTI
jgi:hypothetical protein